MPRPIRSGGRLWTPHREVRTRRKQGSISFDASGLDSIGRRLNSIDRNIQVLFSDPNGFRKAVGEYGKKALAFQTKAFAKNPTGALQRSWRYRTRAKTPETGLSMEIDFTSDRIYARIHNDGGVIRPKRARALTIPQTGIARRVTGGPRFFPGRLRPTPWGLVDLQGTTQYVWAQQVRIRATGYIDKAQKDTRAHALELIRLRLRKASRGKVAVR